MKYLYIVEDRSGPGEKWANCNTYDNHQDALDRLRYEAAHTYEYRDAWREQEDKLIFLNNARLKTLSGYEMRIDTIEVSE